MDSTNPNPNFITSILTASLKHGRKRVGKCYCEMEGVMLSLLGF